MEKQPEIRQFIALPTDASLIAQLAAKLDEYNTRLTGIGKPWELSHPAFAHTYDGYRDAYYKSGVLLAVLNEIRKGCHQFDTWQLSRNFDARLGTAFNAKDFNNACGVVAYYCGDLPEEELDGGTGLPKVQ